MLCVLASLASASSVRADSSEQIVIPLRGWSSQNVLAHVVGSLLTRRGSNVRYQESNDKELYQQLATGEITLVVEHWDRTHAAFLNAVSHLSSIVQAGEHDALSRVGWWYPRQAASQCPGLPDWRALRNCADVFAPADGETRGRLLSAPIEWLMHDRERVAALDLPFDVVHAPSVDLIWSGLEAAVADDAAILIFNWSPNHVEVLYPGEFVELPARIAGCESDPAVGPNPTAAYDCAHEAAQPIRKLAWAGMPEIWPDAYALLERLALSNAEFSELARLVDANGLSAEEAASLWMEENPQRWQEWLR